MRIFPVTVKRVTTIIQGGSGPNPTDALAIKIVSPDTISAATDSTSVAFGFPETVAVQVEGSTFSVQFLFDEVTPGQSDTNSIAISRLNESNPAPTEAIAVAVTVPDDNASQTDAVSLRIAAVDTNATGSDNFNVSFIFPEVIGGESEQLSLRLTTADVTAVPSDASGYVINSRYNETNATAADVVTIALRIAETVGNQSDAITLRLAITDTTSTPSDTVIIKFTLADTSPVLTDILPSLRFGHFDNVGASSDASSLVARVLTTETANEPPTELRSLRVNGLGDSGVAPSDTRSVLVRSGFTATANAVNVTNPTKAIGLPDQPDPPATADTAQFFAFVRQPVLTGQGVLDVVTPNVPAAGYVAGSAQLWASLFYNNLDIPGVVFYKHDGTTIVLVSTAAGAQELGMHLNGQDGAYGKTEGLGILRMDDPVGTTAQKAIRTYLSTATVANLNACKVRITMNATADLGIIYVDAAYFRTNHN